MLKDIKIGCASSKTKYGARLDTSIVKLEKEAIWSGLFTSNKFKSAPVEICLEKINKKQSNKKNIPQLISDQGSHPGIKVDTGAKVLAGSPKEKITEGSSDETVKKIIG